MDQALAEAVEQDKSGGNVWKDKLYKFYKKLTTKQGLIGDYDYAYLFTPSYPFRNYICRKRGVEPVIREQPFFSLNSEVPVFLGMLLGLQHALAMLAGLITPPIMIAEVANLDTAQQEYLVSAAMITSGILSAIQITRIRIPFTKYYLGSGVISVMGTSFALITLVNNVLPMMYTSGFCPVDSDGNELACPDGYGAILGTAIVCSLLEMALAFTPSRVLHALFPKIVTGPVILCIALSLISSAFENWAGGSSCVDDICPSEGSPRAGQWGSANFIGLGFLVYVTIIISEKWGAPIMRSCSVIVGLLVGCIVAAACGYFDQSSIDIAPSGTFLWVHTYKLSVYGPAVLPMLIVYIILATECIGDVTATCDVSRLEVEGEIYESRIQGAVLADGVGGLLSGLFTITPMSTFAQNNGVIALTKCASRQVGYWACFFLILMGIVGKFGAAIVAIPKPVLGGMTTFLFTSVAVAGIKIISQIPFTRRDRFLLTCSLAPGLGATLVSDWFSYFFTYSGDNDNLSSFLSAITLIMEEGFAICAFIGIFLNLFIPQELDEELLDDIEIQQSNLSVLDGHKSPGISQVLSAKAAEAIGKNASSDKISSCGEDKLNYKVNDQNSSDS